MILQQSATFERKSDGAIAIQCSVCFFSGFSTCHCPSSSSIKSSASTSNSSIASSTSSNASTLNTPAENSNRLTSSSLNSKNKNSAKASSSPKDNQSPQIKDSNSSSSSSAILLVNSSCDDEQKKANQSSTFESATSTTAISASMAFINHDLASSDCETNEAKLRLGKRSIGIICNPNTDSAEKPYQLWLSD